MARVATYRAWAAASGFRATCVISARWPKVRVSVVSSPADTQDRWIQSMVEVLMCVGGRRAGAHTIGTAFRK